MQCLACPFFDGAKEERVYFRVERLDRNVNEFFIFALFSSSSRGFLFRSSSSLLSIYPLSSFVALASSCLSLRPPRVSPGLPQFVGYLLGRGATSSVLRESSLASLWLFISELIIQSLSTLFYFSLMPQLRHGGASS